MQNNYDQLLEETKTKILAMVELKPENQWTLESNKDGYVIQTKTNPENGLKINRTETNADVNPEEFVNFVIDMTRKHEYDSHLQEGKLIEKVDQNTFIFYAKGKPPAILVDARDFCMVSRVYKLGEHHFMTISKSIEHPQAPLVKGIQRGEVVFQSWIVKKLPNGQTNLISIANMNPKGDIPKALINQGAQKQAEGVKKSIEYWIKNIKMIYIQNQYSTKQSLKQYRGQNSIISIKLKFLNLINQFYGISSHIAIDQDSNDSSISI